MSKMIKGRKYITDCENYGDIEREENWLRNINGIRILNRYWDRRDCGTAYIEFEFPCELFVCIYERVDADFDEDINNYLVVHKNNVKSYPILSIDEYNKLHDNFCKSFTNDKITVSLFFEQNEKFSDEAIIDKAILAIGKMGTTIEGVMYKVVDRCKYVHVLFNTNYQGINKKRLSSFGDYCLSGKGWLHDNHIYGELKVNTIFHKNYEKYWDAIKNKKPLLYSDGSYYSPKIEIPYNEYMDGNIIRTEIMHNNKKLYIYIK